MNLLTKIFKRQMKIEDIILANGKVLLKRTEELNIFEIVNCAKNVNYESLGVPITKGDLVICSTTYNSFVLNKTTYYIVTPSAIVGYFLTHQQH